MERYTNILNTYQSSRERNLLLDISYMVITDFKYYLSDYQKERKQKIFDNVKEFDFKFIDKSELIDLMTNKWECPLEILKLIDKACDNYNNQLYDYICHLDNKVKANELMSQYHNIQWSVNNEMGNFKEYCITYGIEIK